MEPKEGPPPTSPRAAAAGGGGGGEAAAGGGGGGSGPLRLGAKAAVGVGSATTTVVAERVAEPQVLRLVLEPRPHVRWDEKVVDNEHMNKKSSKRCCIFHKKRAFGESSSESDSDASDDEGADGSGGGAGDGDGDKKDRHMRIAQPKHPPVRPWETYHA